MANENPFLFYLSTFLVLWVFIYLYYRIRRFTTHLNDRYWILRSPVL